MRAQIVPEEFVQPEVVSARVAERLRNRVAPLALAGDGSGAEGVEGPGWEGWPFGRDLYVSEIYSLIQQVPGVKHVLDVQLGYRPVVPSKELRSVALEEGEEPPAELNLTTVRDRMLRVPADTLLCSLGHEIEVAEL